MSEEQFDFDIYGRKIFFLNPSPSIEADLIAPLRRDEYEVYIIENFRDAKNVLRQNPRSILFADIDSQLSVPEWFNFIQSFKREDSLHQILVFTLSSKLKPTEAAVFRKFSSVDDCVLDLTLGAQTIAQQVNEMLSRHNAKGRRKFLRVDLSFDKNSSMFWNYSGQIHEMHFCFLSSVGMAVKVPPSLVNLKVEKGFELKGLTLKLGTHQTEASAQVFALRRTFVETVWILLLAEDTTESVKDQIRDYVFQVLEERVQLSVNGFKQDETDYTQMNDWNFAAKEKGKSESSLFSHVPGRNFS